jgi:hypothetical protein
MSERDQGALTDCCMADFDWDDESNHFVDGHCELRRCAAVYFTDVGAGNARVLLTRAFNTGMEGTKKNTPTKKVFVRVRCASLPSLSVVTISTYSDMEAARKNGLYGLDNAGSEVTLWPDMLPGVHLVPMEDQHDALAVCVRGKLAGRLGLRKIVPGDPKCRVWMKGSGGKGGAPPAEACDWISCVHDRVFQP